MDSRLRGNDIKKGGYMRRLKALVLLCASALTFSACASIKTASDVPKFERKAAAGDASALDAMLDALKSNDRVKRDKTYDALIAVGQPAVPRLIGLLNDDDPATREYAAAILGNIGDERAVAPLMEMLKSGKTPRYIYAWALGKLKAEAAIAPLITALGEKNDALQKEATRALIGIGAPAVPALVKGLESPVADVRKYSARALSIIEDKRAEGPLDARLSDEDPDVAAAAALALGTAGTEKSIPALIKALDAKDMMTRVNASISLGQLEAKDAVGPLTAIMDKDKNPYVREWSARALENITGNRYKYKDEHGAMVFPYNLYR